SILADGNGNVLADSCLLVLADGNGLVVGDLLLAIATNGDGFVRADLLHSLRANLDRGVAGNFFQEFAAYLGLFVTPHFFKLAGLHNHVAIGADVLAGLFFHAPVHIFFGVHEDLLVAFFVFEAQFVVVARAAAFRAAGHEGGTSLIVGEFVGRHLLVVVDAVG